MQDLGLVAIGRNEGERLRRCLQSARGLGLAIVYVDSGSTDGSVEAARELGAEVVELDLSTPFTAARARNEGLARLLEIAPQARYVQFIDSDCELVSGWIDRARVELDVRPKAAVVCGRRRELHPDQSVYNRLADFEWDTPVGESRSCGGDSMMRVEAFRVVGGFDQNLISGEEPELCVRLRGAGWTVHRIDAEMTRHDMGMTRFSQWWRRAARGGHGYAEGAAIHGRPPERHYLRQTRSTLAWGVAMPAAALTLAWPTWGLSLAALAAAYGILMARVYRHHRRRLQSAAEAAISAAFIVPCKFAEAQGMARYWWGRLSGRRSRLIEYRGQGADPGS